MSESSDQRPKKRRGCWCTAAICSAMLVMIGVLFYQGIQAAREAGRRCWCMNGFMQVGLAMLNYQQANGCFPLAHLVDQNNRPIHSWRLLMLPFLEQQERYKEYRLNEPWNSPHNRALADWPEYPDHPELTPIYLCPSDWKAGRSDTSRVVFVGPNTAFGGTRPVRFKDITDGTSNTALGGEMSESGIHWMEPRDLDVNEMSFKINDKNEIGLRSNHPHCVNVPFADGSVHVINDDIDPKLLKALITINGGEDVSKFSNQ